MGAMDVCMENVEQGRVSNCITGMTEYLEKKNQKPFFSRCSDCDGWPQDAMWHVIMGK